MRELLEFLAGLTHVVALVCACLLMLSVTLGVAYIFIRGMLEK